MIHQSFKWRGVLWSAVLILLIPFMLTQLFGLLYGIYVGFQVRGDPDLLAEGLAGLSAAPLYQVLPYVLIAAVAFWRGQILRNVSAALAAATIAALLSFMLVMALNNPLGAALVDTAITLVVAAGVGVFGVFLGGRRTVTAFDS